MIIWPPDQPTPAVSKLTSPPASTSCPTALGPGLATLIVMKPVDAVAKGRIANTIAIPYDAALYAANMSFIKDTLKYQFGMNIVTAKFQNQVMETVGLPPIIKGLKTGGDLKYITLSAATWNNNVTHLMSVRPIQTKGT